MVLVVYTRYVHSFARIIPISWLLEMCAWCVAEHVVFAVPGSLSHIANGIISKWSTPDGNGV